MSYTQELIRYISEASTAYQAVALQKEMLDAAGFCELKEEEKWNLRLSGSYYVIRDSSALIAFTIPKKTPEFARIMAVHVDSPAFLIKTDPEIQTEDVYVKLNVEAYGSALLSTWFDRPLSIAGRVFVKEKDAAKEILVDLKKDVCMIPSLAIHMDRDANKGHAWDVQKELLPLLSTDKKQSVRALIAKACKVKAQDLLSYDLFLYNRQEPRIWGANEEFFSCARLDDEVCAFASLKALLASKKSPALCVHAMFDHEEVGSSSYRGACSTFLRDTISRIAEALFANEEETLRFLAGSLLLSADNGHAVHPNYPEKCDPTNRPMPGKGVLLKFSGNQKYTTSAATAASVKLLAEKAGIKLQTYQNHANIPGGSTLGNLSIRQLGVPSADIGLAQLAMHSAYETCAIQDLLDLHKLAKTFYA